VQKPALGATRFAAAPAPEIEMNGSARRTCRLVFVTGTDTGVGKTLLTGLLLDHARRHGCKALAMKPFCSGGTADVDFLSALQRDELPREQLNPFYFADPVAPLVAARACGGRVPLQRAVAAVAAVALRCECLFIEGSGGLMVPLGEDFTALDLIRRLRCEVIIAARNRLGTINHIRLSVFALRAARAQKIRVVLMDCAPAWKAATHDVSTVSNPQILAELLAPIPLSRLPYLGPRAVHAGAVKKNRKKTEKVLASILGFGIVPPTFFAKKDAAVKKM
jgi:dethiobiotin synthetase